MPFRELLQILFGRRWAHRTAKTFRVSESSIYKRCVKDGPLSPHDLVRLLGKVPGRRREIETEWRKGLAAAHGLTFEWARREQLARLEREIRQQLDRLSDAVSVLEAVMVPLFVVFYKLRVLGPAVTLFDGHRFARIRSAVSPLRTQRPRFSQARNPAMCCGSMPRWWHCSANSMQLLAEYV